MPAVVHVRQCASQTTGQTSVACQCTAGNPIACKRGYYNPTPGANNETACIKCPLHETSNEGTRSVDDCYCAPDRDELSSGGCGCPRNEYYSAQQDACIECPDHTGSPKGSESCMVCDEDYYLRDLDKLGEAKTTDTCEACLTGTTCAWNSTIRTIVVEPGYWRLTDTTTDIHRCDGSANASACLGGTTKGRCIEGQTGPEVTFVGLKPLTTAVPRATCVSDV